MNYETGNSYNSISTAKTVVALMALARQNDTCEEDHGRRVSQYSRLIGERLGLNAAEIQDLANAAVFHDLGKVAISQSILKKLGRLSVEEFEVMKIHSTVALSVLNKVDALQPVIPFIKHHHERYDGKGYPDGVSGEAIPLGARIIAVAEAFDILVSGAPWKARCSVDEALNEIRCCSGTQFDPVVVDTLCSIIADQYVQI